MEEDGEAGPLRHGSVRKGARKKKGKGFHVLH